MDLTSLRAFLAVVECGSLTAAARSLTYAPSTVSEQIQALERSLDAQLFDRDRRTLVLTADGRRLLPYVKTIMQILDFARADMHVDRTKIWIRLPAPSSDCSEIPKTCCSCCGSEVN
jgi:DNA-binding transcriptional LysR family regulator